MKNAFTLLEVSVTLLILALAASLVVVRYRTPVNNARAENAFELIDRMDQRVRQWTKANNRPAAIKVDLNRGVFTAESENKKLPIPETKIPDGMKLNELRIAEENRFGRDTEIPYTSEGTAPCWAFSLVHSGNREQYHLILGATGQSLTLENEDELKTIERMGEDETRTDVN